jgi:hypothetical protein
VTVSIPQDGTDTVTISTSVAKGSPQPISLSVSVTPPGATATLDRSFLNAGDHATLTINPGSAKVGTPYTITVTATAGSVTHVTSIQVRVGYSVPVTLVVIALIDLVSYVGGFYIYPPLYKRLRMRPRTPPAGKDTTDGKPSRPSRRSAKPAAEPEEPMEPDEEASAADTDSPDDTGTTGGAPDTKASPQ